MRKSCITHRGRSDMNRRRRLLLRVAKRRRRIVDVHFIIPSMLIFSSVGKEQRTIWQFSGSRRRRRRRRQRRAQSDLNSVSFFVRKQFVKWPSLVEEEVDCYLGLLSKRRWQQLVACRRPTHSFGDGGGPIQCERFPALTFIVDQRKKKRTQNRSGCDKTQLEDEADADSSSSYSESQTNRQNDLYRFFHLGRTSGMAVATFPKTK